MRYRGRTADPGGSLALDPAQPVLGCPPLDDEQRRLRVQVGVHDLGDIDAKAVAPFALILFAALSVGTVPFPGVGAASCSSSHRSPGRRSSPRRATAPRRPRPGQPWRCARRAGDRGAGPPPRAHPASSRRPAHLPRRPARSRRAEASRRPARWPSSCAGASLEQRPHAPRELRHCLLHVLPCRHPPMIAPIISTTPHAEPTMPSPGMPRTRFSSRDSSGHGWVSSGCGGRGPVSSMWAFSSGKSSRCCSMAASPVP